jgi:hypothetical protein
MHSTIPRKTSKSIIDIDRGYNTSICCGPTKHCKKIHTLHTTERRQRKKKKTWPMAPRWNRRMSQLRISSFERSLRSRPASALCITDLSTLRCASLSTKIQLSVQFSMRVSLIVHRLSKRRVQNKHVSKAPPLLSSALQHRFLLPNLWGLLCPPSKQAV